MHGPMCVLGTVRGAWKEQRALLAAEPLPQPYVTVNKSLLIFSFVTSHFPSLLNICNFDPPGLYLEYEMLVKI